MNQADDGCTRPLDLRQSNVAPRRKMRGESCGQSDRNWDYSLIMDVDRACTRWLLDRGLEAKRYNILPF
jgi:hypothetical protein